MYKSINVDAAVEHLKNIVDCIRCPICDRTDGSRMRYGCGHTSCEGCVVLAADCSVCLTLTQSASKEPVVDKPFTQRAVAAVNLLNVFQNEFHIDVYKRHRLSEQLKVEKDLFPECIQAPAKYINKRKSFNNTERDKENRLSQLPGEEVSPIGNHIMENRSKNVEKWLNQYVRKPFADLNSNDGTLRQDTHIFKKQKNTFTNENTHPKKTNRKRPKTALSIVKNQSSMIDHMTLVKKTKIYHKEPKTEKICVEPNTSKYFNMSTNMNTINNNQSGEVIEDEAVIIIDDSQSVRIDKDKIALLAIQEAEHNKQQHESTSLMISRSIELTPLKDKVIEAKKGAYIPFYLKGYLSDKCTDCNKSNNDVSETMVESNNNPVSNAELSKDVSITVENNSFITVINIKQNQNLNKTNNMLSVGVQTEPKEKNAVNVDVESPSQDIFLDEKLENENKEIILKPSNKPINVLIEETDSDEDIEASVSMEVIAEIHRSCEQVDYGILADINNLREHSKRARRAPRGATPTSSNSSEKENYNPNKMKKAPTSKKKPMKK